MRWPALKTILAPSTQQYHFTMASKLDFVRSTTRASLRGDFAVSLAGVSMTEVVDLLIAILQTWTRSYPFITVSLTASPGERRVQIGWGNSAAPDWCDTGWKLDVEGVECERDHAVEA